MLSKTKKSLEASQIIIHGTEKQYFLNGLADGIPFINPALLNELCEVILSKFDFEDVDRLVCIEAMGIPITTLLSYKTGIPFTIIRKKKYNLENEVEITQNTSYKQNSKLYINGLDKNETIVLLDDVIHTGGTLSPIVKTLTQMGITIKHIIILFEIINNFQNANFEYEPLLCLQIQNNQIKVIEKE